jgi:(p)ppGpp synthase/HD superfamily hydrolase
MPLSSKREGYTFVGAHFPPQIFQYLTLYTLARRTQKTRIIRKLIEDWFIKQRLESSETKLIIDIISRSKQEWDVYRKLYPDRTISQYKEKIRGELQEKGVNENYIKRIIAGI